MPKREIVSIVEEHAGKAETRYLCYEEDAILMDNETLVSHPTPTLEELANFCDQEAESRNAHSFVGTHRILAAFLHRAVGRAQATTIMQGIAEYSSNEERTPSENLSAQTGRAMRRFLTRTLFTWSCTEYGGLDGMSGVGGEPAAFADFGIEDCWANWSLPL